MNKKKGGDSPFFMLQEGNLELNEEYLILQECGLGGQVKC